MKNKLNFCFLMFFLLIFAGLASACGDEAASVENSSTDSEDEDFWSADYDFSSGQPSGVMYPTSVSISNLLEKHTDWTGNMNIFPGGGLSNVMNIENDKAHFGISYSSAVYSALIGEGSFQKPHENIANGASLFPFYAHWVVPEESDIESIEDLKGKKVNLGTKGQASSMVAEAIFEVHGMSEEDLGTASFLNYDDAFQQLKDGQLDALFLQQDAPYSGFQELAQTVGIKLIPIAEDKLSALQEKNPGMIPSVIEGGTYTGIEEDITTVMTPISFVVKKDLPDELVYQLVKAMSENFEEFQASLPPLKAVEGPEDFTRNIGLEFHPGAKKYYEEQGWIE